MGRLPGGQHFGVSADRRLRRRLPVLDQTGARDRRLIASALIVLGLVLSVAEHVGRRSKTIDQLRPRDGDLIGLAQSLALIPGVSRSGATIFAGLFAGYNRADAARFSFLLSARLLRWLVTHTLMVFVVYGAVGILIWVLLGAGVLDAT